MILEMEIYSGQKLKQSDVSSVTIQKRVLLDVISSLLIQVRCFQ